MSHAMTQEELFQEILITKTRGDETSVEFREICTAAGLFDHDPRLARAEESYKDRRIRELARMEGWTDKDGNPLELVNIVRVDTETNRKIHCWVQLALLSFEDQVQLVRDRLERANYFKDEARRYYHNGCDKFGRKFQKLFNFGGNGMN